MRVLRASRPPSIQGDQRAGLASTGDAQFGAVRTLRGSEIRPQSDLAKTSLVTEAKTAGWDGKIRVMAANTPEGTNWAEAVRSQLVSAGMDVTVDNTKDTAGVVNQVLTLRDYDLASWGYAILDDVDAAYTALLASFNSKTLRYGYGTVEFDAAVELLRTADTDPKRVEAYKRVSEIWIRDLPAHVMTALPQGWIYTPKLHGVQRNAYTSITSKRGSKVPNLGVCRSSPPKGLSRLLPTLKGRRPPPGSSARSAFLEVSRDKRKPFDQCTSSTARLLASIRLRCDTGTSPRSCLSRS